MSRGSSTVLCRIALAALLLTGIGAEPRAQNDPNRPAVDVFWKQTATLRVPGITQATALDETICQVRMSGDELQLTGAMVGDTVVFLWIDGVRTAMVVRVTPQPDQPAAPVLSTRAAAAIGQGRVGTTAMLNASSDTTPLVTHQYWDWQQKRDGARLSVHGFNDTYTGRSHAFNLSSLSVKYAKPEWTLSLMDFPLAMGPAGAPASALAQYGAFSVRGVDYVATRGRNRFEVFGGSTVPSYFLSFADTRALGGFKVDREVTPRFGLFAAAGAVHAVTVRTRDAGRPAMPFSLTGAIYTPSPRISMKASGGASRQGFMADAQVDYTGGRFAGSVAASDSAAQFPLNQVQLLTTSEAAVRAMGTLQWSIVSLTTTARHAVAKPNGLAVLRGASDSIGESVQVSLPFHQHVSANASRSVSTGSILGGSSTTQFDASWSSPFGSRAANTLQVGTGHIREASGLNSFREFTFRDSSTLSFPFGSIALAFERQRLDPSIPARIRQVIDALPPPLQELFQLNPTLFLQNVEVPGDIRQLLDRVQPTSTSLSIGGNFTRKRLSVSPTLNVMRDTLTGDAARLNYILGYSATLQLGSTWQLRSALSSQIYYSRAAAGFQRTNVFTIGLDKQLHGLPRWLPVAPKYAIEGYVFRDRSIDGAIAPDEPGFGSVRVRLDDGRVATTDKTGHFKFSGVAPGRRHISLDLAQFQDRVRVTTPAEAAVEVTDRPVQVHFGIVDFARLMGTVFNDYHNDSNRQSDAPGLGGVTVRAKSDSFSTETTTDGSGDYEIDDLPPGDYTVTIAAADLPADYVMGVESQRVHVDPLGTAILDVPVRALRSISGRVVFKRDDVLAPLEGVVITAGDATTTTDADGRFVFRAMPAGAIEFRVMPVRPVPERLRLPFGVLRMKMDPTRVENANVIITNPELIEYLTTSQPASVSR